jgi:hypothetical protein
MEENGWIVGGHETLYVHSRSLTTNHYCYCYKLMFFYYLLTSQNSNDDDLLELVYKVRQSIGWI